MAVEVQSLLSTVVNSTGVSAAVPVPPGDSVAVLINASGVSGTTPSFTFEVQWSNDAVNWHSNDGTADTFAAITANKATCKAFTPKGKLMRLSFTVSGTTPSSNVVATVAGQVTDVQAD